MSKILSFILLVFFQHKNWVFFIDARSISPVSAPLYSPLTSPNLPSMAVFSPGFQVGGEETNMNSNSRLRVALILACASVGVVILSLISLWIYHRKKLGKPTKNHARNLDFVSRFSLNQSKNGLNSLKLNGKLSGFISNMDYKLLEAATGNFDESNVLGVGGFGCVYKAKLDSDCYVAVKKINGGHQEAEKEFENEIDLLSNIRHHNIIALLGYCIHGDTRFLVYELMENGCLETQLHGASRGSALTWHIRMKIALDIARGLEYLHEHCNPPVIHRDLKSSNILLDSEFNAKLSDFGLAITNGPHIKNNIKLSGTLGYVAPEYLLDGKLTDKSDVYAFGVVLLELLLGRKPVEKLSPSQCQSIVTWAMPQLTDRTKLPNIVDPVIRDTMDPKHLYQVAAVAVLCVQPEPSYRPLIIDVLHSLVPLVPVELGGTLRVNQRANSKTSAASLEQQTV
ncbi:probable receptor-like protein kinase At1g80640 isoform X2 [Amaranthus tricolor]|uniref:probable receptor-like protein kinase At1g80640 isoform X2 n=1 Tax=Amaranthus tricolor TaxID=29722 RepID=UPI002590E5F1|nr:probable receptor-like protein kinase At1g80640 isoform X2 [Amaranthus tricolor]